MVSVCLHGRYHSLYPCVQLAQAVNTYTSPAKHDEAEYLRIPSWRSALSRGGLYVWYAALIGILLFISSTRAQAQGYSKERIQFLEGVSHPNRIAKLAAAGTGIVSQLNVSEGVFVSKGQCLVELDRRVHDKQLASARLSMESEGEIKAAEAQLASSERRILIIRKLRQKGSATAEEVLRAENEYSLALANLQSAREKQAIRRTEYERLETQTSNFCISAPFDGVVVEHLRALGEFVGPAEPGVCVLAEIDKLSVEFLIPRKSQLGFDIGKEVNVHFVESNRHAAGRVYYVSPYPNGETNTVKVKVRVNNQDHLINAGERCMIEYDNGRPASPKTKNKRFVSTERTSK